ncbi:MAG: hypothetical protein EXS36_00105 [Pedosphaera sp.]|nr:hypothetical protein [Pedosphaera sp.]
MKPSRLLLSLVCAQVLIALLVAYLCQQQIQATRQAGIQARGINELATQVSQNQRALQVLVSDAIDYSKKQPAIDPLLISLGVKASVTNPPFPSTTPAHAPNSKRAKGTR